MIKIVLIILLVVLALAIVWVLIAFMIAGATAHALYPWRGALIGRRSCPPPPADPYSSPVGEWPVVPMTPEILNDLGSRELDEVARRSAGRAAPAEEGSGGDGTSSSQGVAAARSYRGRERRGY